MQLLVVREPTSKNVTHGKLFRNGIFQCYTLEDAIRDVKIPKETAIPPGEYIVVLDYSNRFEQIMPHLLDVPNFTGIRIHSGNVADDTDGCILVGNRRTSKSILRSRDAFRDLMARLQSSADEIRIRVENPA